MSGHFELNVFKPLVVSNVLNSIYALSNGINNFNQIIRNLKPDLERINELMSKSLMLVTALNPYIGYEKAAELAKYAHKKGLTLKEAAIQTKILKEEDFNKYIKPEKMVTPDD
jgi:fumarate hydratase, class II